MFYSWVFGQKKAQDAKEWSAFMDYPVLSPTLTMIIYKEANIVTTVFLGITNINLKIAPQSILPHRIATHEKRTRVGRTKDAQKPPGQT